jgi:energy-coupling factor transporter ATP-binding protein EcfA2
MSKYTDYFDIDPKYFPCVDDAALRAGVDWKAFFPHETFVALLTETERVLARQNKVSIWIEGAYGTGKSYAAWTLKNILECPEADLQAYFARHPEKLRKDLLNKLLGHKTGGGIIVAHRYASSSIRGDRDLILAVQESVRKALDAAKVADKGETTLKESVVKWITEPTHKKFFDDLLKSDKYRHVFQGKDADTVLTQLKGNGDIHDLMESIFKLASQEGITALDTDMDALVTWLEDVIDRNKLKALVLVWDEFSEYFKNNRHSLTEFQKLAAVCQNKPFYLLIVTHESGSLFSDQDLDWKKLRERFHRAEIALPENIAFDLIAYEALVKKEAAKDDWARKADDLNSRMAESCKAVAAAAQVDDKVLQDIAPLHPMAALLLKHIAKSFKANQRSMFDFIKNHAGNDDVKAFQWFISQYGPQDEDALLTIDHLWNFFYERGRDDLTQEIRAVLDSYPRAKDRLDKNERRVLKTVLSMQAVNQRLSLNILKATDANLALAFEGTVLENGPAVNIAKKLVRDEILFVNNLGGGKSTYSAMTTGVIDPRIRETIVKGSTTEFLVKNGELGDVLPLTPAQKLRWETVSVSLDNFTRRTNSLRSSKTGESWKMKAVIGFAKDDAERDTLRKLMQDAASKEDYKNILFIDTSATPLGQARFNDYVDYMSNSEGHKGRDNAQSAEYATKGKAVLTEWKNEIYNGQFVFYDAVNPLGTMVATGSQALVELTSTALRKYPLAFDDLKVREMLFGPVKKADTEKGIKDIALLAGAAGEKEKQDILGSPSVAKLKAKVDAAVKAGFDKIGRISLIDIFDALLELGFMPTNLYGFVMGHLLREYSTDQYRWSDGQTAETMTPEKLAGSIAEAIKHRLTPIRNYRDESIVLMTKEERAFCELTSRVFSIEENQCVSVEVSARLVSAAMKGFVYPLWVLDDPALADYLELVSQQGKKLSEVAQKIGRAAPANPALGDKLKALVTKENTRKEMEAFLATFEGGKVMALAQEIGAEPLPDVASKFDSSESLWLWDKATGEERIRDLILDYESVAKSNTVNPPAKSLKGCYTGWRDRLTLVKMPWEALQNEFLSCAKLLEMLRDIATNGQLIADKRRIFLNELNANMEPMKSLFNDSAKHFKSVYRTYLEGLDDDEVSAVSDNLENRIFVREKSEAYGIVIKAVESVKRKQSGTRLRKRWQTKTRSKTPREWSMIHKTPILCLAPEAEYEETKRAFDTINRENSMNAEIAIAEAWLEKAAWLADLNDETKCETAFKSKVMGRLASMLPSVDEVRDILSDKIAAEPYDWFPSPDVQTKLEAEAEKHYFAGGSGKVAAKIDAMDETVLKAWLKKLVNNNMTVGIEIIGEDAS